MAPNGTPPPPPHTQGENQHISSVITKGGGANGVSIGGMSGTGIDPDRDSGALRAPPHSGHGGHSGGGKMTPPALAPL